MIFYNILLLTNSPNGIILFKSVIPVALLVAKNILQNLNVTQSKQYFKSHVKKFQYFVKYIK